MVDAALKQSKTNYIHTTHTQILKIKTHLFCLSGCVRDSEQHDIDKGL